MSQLETHDFGFPNLTAAATTLTSARSTRTRKTAVRQVVSIPALTTTNPTIPSADTVRLTIARGTTSSTKTTVTLKFYSNEGGKFYYKASNTSSASSYSSVTLTAGKTNTVTITGVAATITRLYFYAVDEAGNSTSIPDYIEIPSVDTTAPTITNATLVRNTSLTTYATFTFTSSENSTLYYAVSAYNFTTTAGLNFTKYGDINAGRIRGTSITRFRPPPARASITTRVDEGRQSVDFIFALSDRRGRHDERDYSECQAHRSDRPCCRRDTRYHCFEGFDR